MIYQKRIRIASALDLGQAQDFTAWVVVQRTSTPINQKPLKWEHETVVLHMQRFVPGTSYADIFGVLKERFAEPPLKGTTLIVDQTGVGKPVINFLREVKINCAVRRVTLVTGLQAGLDGKGSWLLPKKDLVGQLQVLLQNGLLKIPKALPDATVLSDELNMFKIKPPKLTDSIELDWRERPHDDLVLALALACWESERRNGMDQYLDDRERYPELCPGRPQ